MENSNCCKYTSLQIELPNEKKRESNFELMRIFAMFIIVWHHMCQHGIYFPDNSPITFNLMLVRGTYCWTGMLGNYLFVFVSGYFIAKSKFSWRKVFKFWFQIFSTSVLIGLTLYLAQIPLIGFYNGDYGRLSFFEAAKPATMKDLIRSCLPTVFGNNWFASAYFLFYLFVPFLNESLKVLDKKKHILLILLMTITGTVIYMIPKQGIFQSSNLYYFILGYYIANYIRLYNPKVLNNQKTNILFTLILETLFVLWIFLVLRFKNKIPFVETHYEQVFSYPFAMTRFPALLNAIFVFSFFKNLHISYNKHLNRIAATTFGIYLVHENLLLNKIIWHRLFKLDNFISSKWLFLIMVFATVITFVGCSIIDLCRQQIIEKPVMRLYDKIVKKDEII